MKLLFSILRKILSLRYNVQINGTDLLQNEGTKLFLPNHQAAVLDPLILVSNIYKYTKIVPVVTDSYYDKPLLKSIFKKWGAVRVKDIFKGSTDLNILREINHQMYSAIQDGKNVIVYPSGQSAGQGYERIFNKQSAHGLVQTISDDVEIIGVRISGLWGSMWSRAWTGRSPKLVPCLIKGIFLGIINLLFFLPKRSVSIEFVNLSTELKQKAGESRSAFNTFLENFYNKYGEENANFRRHYFFLPKSKRKLPAVIEESESELLKTRSFDKNAIPEEVKKHIKTLIVAETSLPVEEIKLNSHLYLELGIDSLGLVTILTTVTNYYKTDFPTVTDIKTVADICFVALGISSTHIEFPESDLHITGLTKKPVSISNTDSIHSLIVEVFSKNRTESFAWDARSGNINRKDFMTKALVVSKLLKKEVKEDYVGIMLPALQSTTLLIAASYFAGKIPVMFNWTVGRKTLSYCVENSKVKTILSASAFYDKIKEFIPDDVAEKVVFFEKKVPEISLPMKLGGLLQSRLPKLLINTKPKHEIAVVLFTSGSENHPKTVPLTHKNILSQIKGVLDNIDMYNTTIMLNFLPPFHSFGFSVLNIYPLVTGLKLACTPDPTDTDMILDVLRHTKASFMAGTPTFLKMILSKGKVGDFSNFDFSISGAERLPESVVHLYKEKTNGALLLEGYGITECSPIISFNPREKQVLNSVGKPISTIDVRIVTIDTHKPLAANEEGMIIVSGPSVFNGYADALIDDPFIDVDNKRFYVTGDLGYINDEGYLFISGRLKRFIKVAGEMISLPMIESLLIEKYSSDEEPVLAIEGNDTDNNHKIVLFSTISIDIVEANKYLLRNGLPAISKITEIRRIQEIPLLGSGKVDYKVLKTML